MIFDIVSYFNELELLNLRLQTLKSLVDCFVIVESNVTHSGITKEYTLEKYLSELQKNYNIVYVKHEGIENVENPWVNENNQRNAAIKVLDLKDEDILLISDVDEIPSPIFINGVIRSNFTGVHISIQEMSFFWPNLRSSDQPVWMGGTRAIKWKNHIHIDTWRSNYSSSFLDYLNIEFTLTKLRLVNIGRPVLNGGWHLSYYGGVERIARKLSSFAHTELNSTKSSLSRIDNLMNNQRGFFSNESYSIFGSYLDNYILERAPSNFKNGNYFHELKAKHMALRYYIKIYLKYYAKVFV